MGSFREDIIEFTKSSKQSPVLAAIAAGLYPLLYYYNANFTLLNSWEQVLFFSVYFIVAPIFVFLFCQWLVNKIIFFNPINRFLLPILNFSWLAYLLVIVTQGFSVKRIIVVVLVAILLAILLAKYFKKIIVIQLLMSVVVGGILLNYVFFDIQKPETWMHQPDDIETVIFKKKPNIYLIQPDGYANFSEINKGFYQFDNSDFQNYLINNDFKLYNDFRSNYYSTLSSNSSMFAMKHHYYNHPKTKIREVYNARNILIGKNPVIDIFKKNNYRTHLLLGKSYLLINRGDVTYDFCNMSKDSLSYFSRGFQMSADIFSDLKRLQTTETSESSFYFLEELSPGHITNRSNPGEIAKLERDNYLDKLKTTNSWLKEVLDYISNNDPKAIIIIAADHGGFVGFNSTKEAKMKQTDAALVKSIFTAQLAIKWPNEDYVVYDKGLKTSVNVFRILFSYLAENPAYLNQLQADKSYIPITKGASFGIYEYINENYEVVFNKKTK
ncbi:MAG: hypothetical protein CMC55_04470 [Flavobacteriaceae bacterium]|uniref:hypothetical protein n=1 Tax=Bizionia echini TaxID=649333 RepID=UPI000C935EFA|nr:hypothetical protein [Flavobacteriaceae bacterium]